MQMCGSRNGYNADSDAGKHPHFTHITNESSLTSIVSNVLDSL